MAQGFFFSGEEGNLAGRRKLAELMFRQGMTQQNSRHWMEDAANAAKGILGAYQMSKAEQEQSRVDREAMSGILGTSRPDTVTGSTGMEATAAASATTPPAATPSTARPASFSGGSQEFIQQMMPHAQRVAQQTGIDPRIVIAQAALESGWGRRAPGNNFFGIKSHGAPGGNTLATTEVVNGQPVRTRDSFRAYGSMGESADGYAQFLRQNPRYRPMLQAQGLDAQIQALGASGYATDPNYAAKIRQIASGLQIPSAAPASTPAAPPADSLEGGSGMDGLAAPDLAGSFDQMRRAAPGPMDPRARAFDQITRAGAGMQPTQAMAPAPSTDDMMAGQQVQQPMQAPMPVPRPQIPEAPTALAQAPVPQPRPNLEPPAGAQQAAARQQIAGMMGLNERDRLMMLRDEQSLAPGEADTLRAGLGGQAPAQQAPQTASPSANPIARLREMVVGGGSAPAAPSGPAQAQRPSAPSAAAPAGDQRARLMQIIMNPNVSPTVRQGAMMAVQQMQPDVQIVPRPDGSVLAIDKRTGQSRVVASGTNAPPQLQPIKDAAGNVVGTFNPVTGETRAPGGQQGAAPPRIEGTRTITDPAERARLGIPPNDPRPYQLKPDGSLSAVGGAVQGGPSDADKAARRAAEDAVAQAQGGLQTINRAIELNSTAYTGPTAGIRATIGGQLGMQSAQDTQIFRNSAMSGVLSSLKSIFGGNPTEGERKILLEVEGAVDAPERVRTEILNRAKSAAEQRIALNQRRIAELGGPAASQEGVRSVQTPAEAQNLPPGTRYRTPDGREYTR